MKRGGWNGARLKGFSNTCEGDGKHSFSGRKKPSVLQNVTLSFRDERLFVTCVRLKNDYIRKKSRHGTKGARSG